MINFLIAAQIDGIKAQGNATLRQIQQSEGDPEEKAIAIAKAIVSTQQAIAKLKLDNT